MRMKQSTYVDNEEVIGFSQTSESVRRGLTEMLTVEEEADLGQTVNQPVV